MILNVTSVIQCDLITLTQTTVRILWLCWHQEDQTVPGSPPRCHRKIPRIASFHENWGQRAKMLESCLYRSLSRNVKTARGEINVRWVVFGCVTRTHCRYFWFPPPGGSTSWPKWEVLVSEILGEFKFSAAQKIFFLLFFLRCAFVCVFCYMSKFGAGGLLMRRT